MTITAREWLNVWAILNSIDEVPGMPSDAPEHANAKLKAEMDRAYSRARETEFIANPVRFLRKADEPTVAAIWAEVSRRLAGGA